jgi:hypothetical protein
MKKLSVPLLAAIALATISVTGCSAVVRVTGNGEIVRKTYDYKDFTRVEFSDAIKYEVRQSDNFSVIVSAGQNIIEHMDIYQSGSTLHIGLKPGEYFNSDTNVTVTMPQLNELAVSGSCKGTAAGFDSNSNLEIKVSGASNLDMGIKAGRSGLDISGSSKITGNLTSADTQIKLSGASRLNMTMKTGKLGMDISGSSNAGGDLECTDAQFRLSGASNCELTGSAADTSIDASGSSKMDSPELVLKSADVKLTGASYAGIRTDGVLNINLSGSSRLDYWGNPAIKEIDISGASAINHK